MDDRYCPCCLFRGMQMRLDKKGRPYLACRCCTTMIFVRGGELGAMCAAAVLRMLDSPTAREAVADSARSDVARPTALADMLRPAVAASPLTLDPSAHERLMGVAVNG